MGYRTIYVEQHTPLTTETLGDIYYLLLFFYCSSSVIYYTYYLCILYLYRDIDVF